MGIAYVRMKILCMHIINEVHANIEIQFLSMFCLG